MAHLVLQESLWPSLRTDMLKQMIPRGLKNFHKLVVGTHFHVQNGTNLPQYFYLGHYFQVLSPYYQAAEYKQKTPIPESSRRQVSSKEAKKGQVSTLITANNRIHFHRPVSTDLMIQFQF